MWWSRQLLSRASPWRSPVFAAMRHRNYRLFFAGQLISLIGTWMQGVAQGWLVLGLTEHPAFALGLVGAAGSAPVLAFSLLAGAVADRTNKRLLLVAAQSAMAVLALALALLSSFNLIQVWHVVLLSALSGTAMAFDMPTRQAFVVEMVGRRDLMNAIGLNSTMFNMARVVGPGVAGLLVASMGVAGCFYVNAASFLAVIVALLMMRIPYTHPESRASLWSELGEGFRYFLLSRATTGVMLLLMCVTLFGLSYGVLMPVFARDVLGSDARGFGLLSASPGVGALIGGITVASGLTRRASRQLLGGLFVFCFSLVLFSYSHLLLLSCGVLAITGWAMVLYGATSNTVVQSSVPDQLRGRVMGAYMFVVAGMLPFGSLLFGAAAAHWGAPMAVRMAGIVCALVAFALFRTIPEMRRLQIGEES